VNSHGARVKVINITGFSRSGSTLLGRLTGQIEGFHTTGELEYIWRRFLEDGWCGCHAHLKDCPIWGEVIQRTRDNASMDPEEMVLLQRRILKTRHIPRLLLTGKDEHRSWPMLDRYMRATSELYRSVRDITGSRVVVDTSHFAYHAAVLRLLDGVDAYFVHLVRDPRAVVHSWQRHKRSGEAMEGVGTQLRPLPPRRVAVTWTRFNVATELVCRRHGRARFLRLRYEDFIAAPQETLLSVAALAGERPADLPFLQGSSALLETNHTASGNPDRFTGGWTELREDDERRTLMPERDRRLVTTIALPLLLRFGYDVRSSAAEA
jgi:sulfotransferase family protein